MISNNNTDNIRICSYNCNSVRKKVDIIRELMEKSDILFLQELILLNEDCDFIYEMSDLFDAHVLPSKCSVS